MEENRLAQIIEFCKLIDKEKFITRHTLLTDGQRLENDAEHSWHIAVMALLLSEYANEKIDLLKVISILLVHDLVEIYAGDTFAYDQEGKKTQRQREAQSADRLFTQLPPDLANKLRALWDEFEESNTIESKFAHTLDNIQPMMLQHATNGKTWRKDHRKLSEVLNRNENTPQGSIQLWNYAKTHFITPEITSGNIIDDTP